MDQTLFNEAIKKKDFSKIENFIKTDTASFNNLKQYEKESLIQTALRHKAFSLILTLVDANLITTDLFEIDNWVGSFLWIVLLQTPFEKDAKGMRNLRPTNTIEDIDELDEESLKFFQSFASKIENIDEEVENKTILEFAISKNLPIPVLQILVDSGCPTDTYDNSENTLLFQRITPQVGKWFIEQGLNVNHKNKGNSTPLENAIKNSNQELVKMLLNNGADINHKNKEGNSMFYFALIDKIDYDLFDMLCEYDSPDFHHINQRGSTFLFDYIDRLTSSSGKPIEYLKKLIELGGDVQQLNTTFYGEEKTPLDRALEKDVEIFETVLDYYNADINQTDTNGNTLLHKVCGLNLNFDQNKAKDIYRKVKLLLAKGADPSIRNSQDKTAIDLAVDDNLKEKTVALLLKK